MLDYYDVDLDYYDLKVDYDYGEVEVDFHDSYEADAYSERASEDSRDSRVSRVYYDDQEMDHINIKISNDEPVNIKTTNLKTPNVFEKPSNIKTTNLNTPSVNVRPFNTKTTNLKTPNIIVKPSNTITPNITVKPTNNLKSPGRNVTFFHKNGNEFINTLVECIRDEHCQIFYHHVQKAAGTYIGSRLFPWMNNRFPNVMITEIREGLAQQPQPPKSKTSKWIQFSNQKWCCYDKVMQNMRRDPQQFCRYKFSTWEITAKQMAEVMDTCFFRNKSKPLQRSENNRKAYNYTRAVVLVTYRDPIERFTSLVHQLCNVGSDFYKATARQILAGNWNTLQFIKSPAALKELSDACGRCAYNTKGRYLSPKYANDADIWDRLARDTIRVLNGVSELIGLIQAKNQISTKHAHTLVLDSKDVSIFFRRLQNNFPNKPIPLGHKNEKLPFKTCYFKTKTFPRLMKSLLPGREVYHKLTLGKF